MQGFEPDAKDAWDLNPYIMNPYWKIKINRQIIRLTFIICNMNYFSFLFFLPTQKLGIMRMNATDGISRFNRLPFEK